MIVDTHIHLNMHQYNSDLDQVVKRAFDAGIQKMIVVGMDQKHNLKALEIAHKYQGLYASVGIHPVDVDKLTLDDVLTVIDDPKVVAVGETGIDLHWRKDNLDFQKEVFIQQIELAINKHLPIIVHTRNSFKEAYDCLLPYKGKIKGVFHAFSSTLEDAKKALDLGFYIGIGGVVTFKKATELKAIVRAIDLKHLLIETDGPFLAPDPFRGQRNEPAYNVYIVKAVADIKSVDEALVKKVTTENAHKLFRLE